MFRPRNPRSPNSRRASSRSPRRKTAFNIRPKRATSVARSRRGKRPKRRSLSPSLRGWKAKGAARASRRSPRDTRGKRDAKAAPPTVATNTGTVSKEEATAPAAAQATGTNTTTAVINAAAAAIAITSVLTKPPASPTESKPAAATADTKPCRDVNIKDIKRSKDVNFDDSKTAVASKNVSSADHHAKKPFARQSAESGTKELTRDQKDESNAHDSAEIGTTQLTSDQGGESSAHDSAETGTTQLTADKEGKNFTRQSAETGNTHLTTDQQDESLARESAGTSTTKPTTTTKSSTPEIPSDLPIPPTAIIPIPVGVETTGASEDPASKQQSPNRITRLQNPPQAHEVAHSQETSVTKSPQPSKTIGYIKSRNPMLKDNSPETIGDPAPTSNEIIASPTSEVAQPQGTADKTESSPPDTTSLGQDQNEAQSPARSHSPQKTKLVSALKLWKTGRKPKQLPEVEGHMPVPPTVSVTVCPGVKKDEKADHEIPTVPPAVEKADEADQLNTAVATTPAATPPAAIPPAAATTPPTAASGDTHTKQQSPTLGRTTTVDPAPAAPAPAPKTAAPEQKPGLFIKIVTSAFGAALSTALGSKLSSVFRGRSSEKFERAAPESPPETTPLLPHDPLVDQPEETSQDAKDEPAEEAPEAPTMLSTPPPTAMSQESPPSVPVTTSNESADRPSPQETSSTGQGNQSAQESSDDEGPGADHVRWLLEMSLVV